MPASRIDELNQLLSGNRARLLRMVRLRIDSRLTGRVDESDVIQEAYAEAATRYEDFCIDRHCSSFVWLRFLTLQKLAQIHRHHIKVQARSVKREATLQKPTPAATSAILAREFMGKAATPVETVMLAEMKRQLKEALDRLKDSDREILAMRHFEQMDNQEVAETLGIQKDSAYKRYVRALKRLKAELGDLPMSLSFNS